MRRRALIAVLVLAGLFLPAAHNASGKIYVDITSPFFRQFPIAMYDFSPDERGRFITAVVREDLEFTNLFRFVDPAAFLEDKADDFNRKNWIPLGVDAVLKGEVVVTDKVQVTVKFYDVVESSVILHKRYSADKGIEETLAHAISDDIYEALTGQKGVFRSKLAFVADRDGEKDLHVMDYDGRRVKRLGFSRPLMLAPHWSKDKSKVVISIMENTQWAIYLIDLKTLKSTRVFASEGVNIAGDFSPRGDSFVFSSSANGSPNIYVYDLRSGQARMIGSSIWIDVSPAFSPDGREVAFVSNRSGSPHVYIMDINGYNIRRVTFEGSYNTSPSWSPSQDILAFTGMVNGSNQVFTVRSDGTGMTQLTEKGNNEDPVFSPDGRFIAFTSDRTGKKKVYIMTVRGENQKQVSPAGYRAFGPEWF